MPNALRSTMADLVDEVRTLINDPAGATQIFADTDIQNALDRTRVFANYWPLRPEPTISTSNVTYHDYFADYNYARTTSAAFAGNRLFSPGGYATVGLDEPPYVWGDWESNAAFYDASWAALTPTTSDYLTGHWTFGGGQNPPVYLVGYTYDVYRTASRLLLDWAAKEMLNYDHEYNHTVHKESQKARALRDLAKEYEQRRRVQPIMMSRHDVNA